MSASGGRTHAPPAKAGAKAGAKAAAKAAATVGRLKQGARGSEGPDADAIRAALAGAGVRPRLTVSEPGDAFEREAESVAAHVAAGVRAPAIAALAGAASADRAAKRPEEDPKKVQRAAAKQEDEAPRKVQRAATAAGHADDLAHRAERAVAAKGSGRPLDSGMRSLLEGRMGADLGRVRVHDDSAARAAAESIEARAFTHGSDIWLGPGESEHDTRLMAHEATHVVQQQGGAARQTVQRLGETPPAGDAAVDPATLSPEVGQYVPGTGGGAGEIRFATVGIPRFKHEGTRGERYAARAGSRTLRYHRGYERGNPDQRNKWRRDLPKATIRDRLVAKESAAHAEPYAGTTHYFMITLGSSQRAFYFGSLDEIATELAIPTWDHGSSPSFHLYDVDHIVELQLANWPTDQSANEMANFELLDSEANQASGRAIKLDIDTRVQRFLDAGGRSLGSSVEAIKSRYDLVFLSTTPLRSERVTRDMYWTPQEIQDGAHLAAVRAAGPGDLGRAGEVRLIGRERGGISKLFTWRGPDEEVPRPVEADWLKPFTIVSKEFNTGPDDVTNETFGTLTLRVPDDDKVWQQTGGDIREAVTRVPGARYAGTINKNSLRQRLGSALRIKGASPIEVDEFEIENTGLEAGGRIASDIPLLRDADIRFGIVHGDARVFKTFQGPEIPLPPPFSITDLSLTLFISARDGLGVDGNVAFEVAGLGSGAITATASTNGPIQFAGHFDIDSRYFDPARLSFTYDMATDRWTGAGDIGLRDGVIPGVASATGHVDYDGTTLNGSLTVEPTIRAIQRGQLDFSHSEADGLRFTGMLQLGADLPGIRGGQVTAELSRPPGQESFDIAVTGDVESAIAGFDPTLHLEYRNGAFTATAAGRFQRGMLSGEVSVGVTNRTLDATGQPTGEPDPTAPLIIYGRGDATLALAPWLQATASLEFAPNGEVTIIGEIGLPSSFEIFSRREVERRLLDIAIQVPIVPGIVAEIGGSLSAQAGIGPGALDELRLSVTYNPAHEDQTHIVGDAHLNIPADAGLRLAVRAGIGLGITGASATGGLEIGGLAGIAGAAEAGVHVDWTPARGLVVDAFGELHAEPVFRFDVSGYVSVRALGFSVYDETFELASVEYGSNLRLGVRFPVHYAEGEPFDISLDQVEFIVPDVDPAALLRGLVSQIT